MMNVAGCRSYFVLLKTSVLLGVICSVFSFGRTLEN